MRRSNKQWEINFHWFLKILGRDFMNKFQENLKMTPSTGKTTMCKKTPVRWIILKAASKKSKCIRTDRSAWRRILMDIEDFTQISEHSFSKGLLNRVYSSRRQRKLTRKWRI